MLELFKIALLISAIGIISACLIFAKKPQKHWAFYKSRIKCENLHAFCLLVFDSHSHPPFEDLLESGKMVIGSLSSISDLPGIIQKKFDGIYIDCHEDPLAVIQTIRMQCPKLAIMLKHGFPAEAASQIDMVLAEAIFADRNYQQIVSQLKNMQKANPHLEIYTLDYWNPQDKEMINHIYKEQRKHGFIPYVASIQLDSLICEPK